MKKKKRKIIEQIAWGWCIKEQKENCAESFFFFFCTPACGHLTFGVNKCLYGAIQWNPVRSYC